MTALRAAALLLAAALVLSACGGGGTKTYPVGAQSRPHAHELPSPLVRSAGAVRYVATDGSDGAPGTAARPWRTVQKALDRLQPGQTVVVRRGVYVQNLEMTRSGTADAPITVRGEPGAVLEAGSGAGQNIPLSFANGASYVRISGVTIQGATGDSTADVYAAEGAHDIELAHCDIRRSARQGIFTDRTTLRISIVGCTVQGNGGSGPRNLDHNIYLEGRAQVVVNNLIADAPNGSGVQVYPDSDGVIVAHNTIVSNRLDGIIIGGDGSTTTDDARITNNIVALNGRYGISAYWGGGPVGSNDLARRNLAWRNKAGAFVGKGVDYAENRVADPGFVNPSVGDWHSRASNAGA